MLQLTSRDEAMLDWINVVRLADVDAIRWALSAYQVDHDGPVSVRRANHWIARMAELGYLGRVRPVYRDRQIVWPTFQASGRSAPRLFRQTMRHELAVSAVAGRFLASGYEWKRDRPQILSGTHQADGIARRSSATEIIEVELTSKSPARYATILGDLGRRLSADGECFVRYLCAEDAARAVAQQADRVVFREERRRLKVCSVFDVHGQLLSHWDG